MNICNWNCLCLLYSIRFRIAPCWLDFFSHPTCGFIFFLSVRQSGRYFFLRLSKKQNVCWAFSHCDVCFLYLRNFFFVKYLVTFVNPQKAPAVFEIYETNHVPDKVAEVEIETKVTNLSITHNNVDKIFLFWYSDFAWALSSLNYEIVSLMFCSKRWNHSCFFLSLFNK